MMTMRPSGRVQEGHLYTIYYSKVRNNSITSLRCQCILGPDCRFVVYFCIQFADEGWCVHARCFYGNRLSSASDRQWARSCDLLSWAQLRFSPLSLWVFHFEPGFSDFTHVFCYCYPPEIAQYSLWNCDIELCFYSFSEAAQQFPSVMHFMKTV